MDPLFSLCINSALLGIRVWGLGFRVHIPKGPSVVSFCGLYLESYKVTPKRNCSGAYG